MRSSPARLRRAVALERWIDAEVGARLPAVAEGWLYFVRGLPHMDQYAGDGWG